ncbi:MAG TPA: hypothetical protein VK996_04245 [Ramlibacter sp.]|nr:hypothetical protein [Ramlibacter sp.]
MNKADNATQSRNFLEYIEGKAYNFDYKTYDFLYDHNGPCPQVARDHPFGQAPEVLNIPQSEWDDWNKYVYDYYVSQGVPFALNLAEYSLQPYLTGFSMFGGTIGSAYAEVKDDQFAVLLSEGVYSKFLCPLTAYPALSQKRWGVLDEDREYFISDYTCMRVIEKPWEGEYVAPTVVLLSRPKLDYRVPADYGGSELATVFRVEAIELFYRDGDKWGELPRPLTPKDGDTWWIAKYFVLQGAIHRINLIDHTRDHFPSDTINALTKTVLPKRNLVSQLLLPHFWLSLPVNNAVLEGDRSLISRSSWYPWSPFVAKGPEVRKLLPFGWYGCGYYEGEDDYFKTPNPSYLPYRFEQAPPNIPSRYGLFFADYFKAVQPFVAKLVAEIPPDSTDHTDWVEIQDWATRIASWMPGFPDWNDLPDTPQGRETLTSTLTMIVLNASVIHSADHGTTHKMFDLAPVPYILRTPPPTSLEYTKPSVSVGDAITLLAMEGKISEATYNTLKADIPALAMGLKFCPLAAPSDLLAGRMTDMLFYRPHNCSLLIDCDYQFTQKGQATLNSGIDKAKQEISYAKAHQYELLSPRLDPVEDRLDATIDELQRQLLEPSPAPANPHFKPGIGKRLQAAVEVFQNDMRSVSSRYASEIATLGFPMIEAPPLVDPSKGQAERREIMRTECIAAGIQY